MENDQIDGVEKLYSSLASPKPKMPSFLSYLNALEINNCLSKKMDPTKKSRRTIKLTNSCRSAIKKIIYD